jgi:hypothetical protein
MHDFQPFDSDSVLGHVTLATPDSNPRFYLSNPTKCRKLGLMGWEQKKMMSGLNNFL